MPNLIGFLKATLHHTEFDIIWVYSCHILEYEFIVFILLLLSICIIIFYN